MDCFEQTQETDVHKNSTVTIITRKISRFSFLSKLSTKETFNLVLFFSLNVSQILQFAYFLLKVVFILGVLIRSSALMILTESRAQC